MRFLKWINWWPRSGGGFPAILYVFRLAWRVGPLRMTRALARRNACKTCALGMGGQLGGMRNEAGRFPEVCKKSVQALASDMQGAIKREFWARLPVPALRALSPRELETSGRISEPVILRHDAKHYQPISYGEAIAHIAEKLRAVAPEKSFFYFSGRSSNEAGFLLQLLARCYGTNHVNNCSYYCHQASGVALKRTIGSGTATLTVDDLDGCDLFFLIGANPSSNHPRLMTILKDLRRRGGHVIVINPVVETGLVRFRVPSDPVSLLRGSAIASEYVQIRTGGDIALLHGIAKCVCADGQADYHYIDAHTEDFTEFRTLIEATHWETIEAACGIPRQKIETLARMYARAKHVVFGWCMGITHHEHGVENVQAIVNVALLRGMIGREYAGLLPIRGHSNVQGMGSMNVTPTLQKAVFDNLVSKGVNPPTWTGLDTMGCMEAAARGDMQVGICLGGNLFGSNPDATFTRAAFAKLDLVVYLSTTLNTGHAHGLGRETIILPVLARDEERQKTTQESMFNYVRLSDGGEQPAVQGLWSEVEVIAALGENLLAGRDVLGWSQFHDHHAIRKLIADTVPGFSGLRDIGTTRKEFYIPGRILHRPIFATSSGRAKFSAVEIPPGWFSGQDSLRLMTVRSEGQFNTVVYDEEDLYRGQERRDVVLMNEADMRRRNLRRDMRVSVRSATGVMENLLVRAGRVAQGSVLMYYPEANHIVDRRLDPYSKTPAFKSTRVHVATDVH